MNDSRPQSAVLLAGRLGLLHAGLCVSCAWAICGWQFSKCVLVTLFILWLLFIFNCSLAWLILRPNRLDADEGEKRPHVIGVFRKP